MQIKEQDVRIAAKQWIQSDKDAIKNGTNYSASTFNNVFIEFDTFVVKNRENGVKRPVWFDTLWNFCLRYNGEEDVPEYIEKIISGAFQRELDLKIAAFHWRNDYHKNFFQMSDQWYNTFHRFLIEVPEKDKPIWFRPLFDWCSGGFRGESPIPLI